jgi:hypothetical protein
LVAYSGLRMVPTKNIDYFEDKDEEFRRKRFDVDEKHLIPFIPSKSVVLTNAGKVASGARISTNVLDSLAKYGALAGVSPVDALGIPTRETSLGLYPGRFLFSPNPFLPEEHTFHGQNKLVDEGVVSPAEIINNDMFYVSPYNHAVAWAGRTVGGVSKAGDSRVRYERNPVTDSDMDAALAKSRAYSDRLAGKINMSEHPLLHGFRLFREKKFNRGELGYEDHVRSDGEAVFNSPEVQKWWISEGKNWYNGTRFEKNPMLKTIFVGEPGYELAGGGKIHIKPENRGKFTALLKRTGKSASWFKEHGTPLQKKRATFALNARKWKHGDGGLIERYGADAVRSALQTVKEHRFGEGGDTEEEYYDVLPASVVTASLPAKFHGSQEAARRYAEGYKFGKRVAQGRDEFANEWVAPAVIGLSAGPAGAIAGLAGRMVDVGVNALTEGNKNTWGDLFVSPQKHPWWNLAANFTNPGYLVAGPLSKGLQNDLTSLGREAVGIPAETVKVTADVPVASELQKPQVVQALAPQTSYEIAGLGGGYMLKSLMRGNPLEKQISKQGTVSVNNIKALMNKGSKVEQAVVDKVLASEEFSGKKAIDYNKFRKAVQDELITYERTPDARWNDYGTGRLGFLRDVDTYRARQRMIDRFVGDHDDVEVFYGAGRNSDRTNVIFGDGEPEDLTMAEIIERFRQHDPAWFSGRTIPGESASTIKTNTYTFSSSRIPRGSAKHYDANTLGHSRTYTTADEPDVLHVMESQSDWAQSKAPIIGSATSVSRGVNGNTDIVLDANGIYRRVGVGEGMPESEFFHTIGDDGLTHYSRFVTQSRNEFPLEQANYLADNYTSKQIQENLRYAAEKGQKKMRYPTRETAAKIEGYPEREAYFDAQGNDITTKRTPEMWSYGEQQDKELRHLRKAIKDLEDEYTTWVQNDTYVRNGLDREGTARAISNDLAEAHISRNSIISENEPKLAKGYSKKVVYDHEDILRKYTEFPKQFKKLYKNADVRTVTDAKGNTWYEVDVPENYLQQEWAYGDGGHLNRLALDGIIERYGKDKIKLALAKMKQSK